MLFTELSLELDMNKIIKVLVSYLLGVIGAFAIVSLIFAENSSDIWEIAEISAAIWAVLILYFLVANLLFKPFGK